MSKKEPTLTGRFPSDKPEMQDLPGSYCEERRKAREKAEGYVCLLVDYSTLEMGIVADMIQKGVPMYQDLYKGLSPLQKRAWEMYCEETAGSADARDDWSQLPHRVRDIFLRKASMEAEEEKIWGKSPIEELTTEQLLHEVIRRIKK